MMTGSEWLANHGPIARDRLLAGCCPLCGVAFDNENARGACDHEADSYRAMLAALSEQLPGA
jgi:hypothetical protein